MIDAQNRGAGLADQSVRFTPGACRRIIREHTSERGVRPVRALRGEDLPQGGAGGLRRATRRWCASASAGQGARVSRRTGGGPCRRVRSPPRAPRRVGAAEGRAGEGWRRGRPTDPEHARERVSLERAANGAQRGEARPGRRARDPRRGARRARRGEGASARLPRRIGVNEELAVWSGPARRRSGTCWRSPTARRGGPGPRLLLGRMPEPRWRVLGRGRGLFAIGGGRRRLVPRDDDGRGGRSAAAAGAVRGGGVPGAARQPGRP